MLYCAASVELLSRQNMLALSCFEGRAACADTTLIPVFCWFFFAEFFLNADRKPSLTIHYYR